MNLYSLTGVEKRWTEVAIRLAIYTDIHTDTQKNPDLLSGISANFLRRFYVLKMGRQITRKPRRPQLELERLKGENGEANRCLINRFVMPSPLFPRGTADSWRPINCLRLSMNQQSPS